MLCFIASAAETRMYMAVGRESGVEGVGTDIECFSEDVYDIYVCVR